MVTRRSRKSSKKSSRSRKKTSSPRRRRRRSSVPRTTSRRRRSTRSRRRRKSQRCLSSRPITWKPQRSSNLPLCPTPQKNPCENPCNNRSEWVKLALRNNYFLTWAKLLAHLGRCDPGNSICQPFGGVTPPEGILNFQKQFKPKVNIVMGLGNKDGDYTLAHVEMSFNNAVLAPPATGSIKGRGLAGPKRGRAIDANFELSSNENEPADIPVVVGGVQKGFGSGMFNQFVELNGEAVLLAEDFCRMPAWPAAKTAEDKKQDKLMVPFGPGCCLPGVPGGGGDLPIMRTQIPPGSVLDDIMLGDCRVPAMKIGIGATLPSLVRRSINWQKNPLDVNTSKAFFIARNKSLAPAKDFTKFKVVFNQEKTCGQNLVEQLFVNTIGDGTTFGYYGEDESGGGKPKTDTVFDILDSAVAVD